MGCSNPPALFQRLVDLVLRGLTRNGCLVYLDDIVIYGSMFEQYLERLTAVFQTINDANVKLHPQKSRLFQPEISLNGHVISAEDRRKSEEGGNDCYLASTAEYNCG